MLGNIDQVWQQYDFVRDLTYFLSLKNRTNRVLNGLLTTKDIIYFFGSNSHVYILYLIRAQR
ncbi:hypothetical protein LWM68_25655 [Niabella sp. W65]|nr:hypothetical protein [Niabella sp. W65]MCH7365852.1 hypothetical protein [Niabella sp. W65]